jgi:hypothetical protein
MLARNQMVHEVVDNSKYGQLNPYLYTNLLLGRGSPGGDLTNDFNFTDQSQFLYDPFDTVRLIMRRHISNAKRIYPNVRVIIKDGYKLPIDCNFQPHRINVETRDDLVIRVYGMY